MADPTVVVVVRQCLHLHVSLFLQSIVLFTVNCVRNVVLTKFGFSKPQIFGAEESNEQTEEPQL